MLFHVEAVGTLVKLTTWHETKPYTRHTTLPIPMPDRWRFVCDRQSMTARPLVYSLLFDGLYLAPLVMWPTVHRENNGK